MSHKAAKSTSPSVYERLVELEYDERIIAIALEKSKIPYSLREDAAQEIRIAWMSAKVKPEFSNGELYSYASTIGVHTARRVWRELGNVLRLPGSAFREKKDGTTYVQPGHLTAPMQWEDMEEILVLNEKEWSSCEYSWDQLPKDLDKSPKNPLEVGALEARLRMILTERQRLIVSLLAQGKSMAQIERKLDIEESTLRRHMRQIRQRLERCAEVDQQLGRETVG